MCVCGPRCRPHLGRRTHKVIVESHLLQKPTRSYEGFEGARASGGAGEGFGDMVTPPGAPALRFIRSHVLKSGEEKEMSAGETLSHSRNSSAAAPSISRTGGKLLRCLQVAPSCGENAASCFSAALPSGLGRLEVPPGSGGSPSEDLEWRDSSDVSGQDRMLKHFGERKEFG